MRDEPSQKRLNTLAALVTETALNISEKLGFQISSNQALLDLQVH
jgi:hypothetical protein